MKKYPVIQQKPYCCVPAAIVTLLESRSLPHKLQEEVGYALGLVVPESAAHHFDRVRTGEPGPAGYGTRVDQPEYALNAYFEREEIPLRETYIPPGDVEDAYEFLSTWLTAENDVIACFENSVVYGGEMGGHVALVADVEEARAVLHDPARPETLQSVAIDVLEEGVETHGEQKRGGYWVIKQK